MSDLKLVIRRLLKNPVLFVPASLTLAIGIGAVTGLVSVIQGVLGTPPPYQDAGQIVLISKVRLDGQPYENGVGSLEWRAWQEERE